MGYTQIHSLQDSLHQNSKKSILSPKWTGQRQQLEASSTRMESMIPQSTRPSTLLSLKRTSHAPSMRMSPQLLTERFTKITTTLLCPFMRCTRTRQSTTPPPLSPLSPWTSSRSKEDTSLAVMSVPMPSQASLVLLAELSAELVPTVLLP